MTEEFRTKMKEQFIPAIERMVEKEKEHLETLMKHRRRMNDRKESDGMSWIKSAIQESERMLEHFQTRLKQYKDYIA